MSAPSRPPLRTLLGSYPVTAALLQGRVRSTQLELDFVDAKPIPSAFKRVVRDVEFDVAELSIVTFLMAKARGVPLALLPAVLVARFQHGLLACKADRPALAPHALEGKRIGVRSYSVTTGAWIRGILAQDYGVNIDRIRWVTFEEAHVAGYQDPPNVERAPAGSKILDMLLAGEIDAAVLGDGMLPDPRFQPVIPDPAAAAAAWQRKHGALQINHMVTVRSALLQNDAQAVREVYRLLAESKRAAQLPPAAGLDLNPFGVEANRRNLEAAIDCVYRQGLIPQPYAVDELFDDTTRALGA